jgi:predicted ATPase
VKIRRISTTNHPVFGNIEIDFTRHGRPVDTILLAGENGTGKTALLEMIYSFLTFELDSVQRNETRDFDIDIADDEIARVKSSPGVPPALELRHRLHFHFDYNIVSDWRQITVTSTDSDDSPAVSIVSHYLTAQPRVLRGLYSVAEITYSPNRIGSVTTGDVDRNLPTSTRSTRDLPTEIAQLLVDISSADAIDFTLWAKDNPGAIIDESKIDVRLRRFTAAFNSIFPTKRFQRVENASGQKRVIFTEFGKEMSLDNLSSGEKQIVFRGSYLLQDRGSSKGSLVLIDEPETSLHPRWQLEIAGFYRRLFSDVNGQPLCQIIIATHSPFVIHNFGRRDDKVIVLSRNHDGQIHIPNSAKYYAWTDEKAIREAFNVEFSTTSFTSGSNTVFVEGETDELYFRTAQQLFGHDTTHTRYAWIGRTNQSGTPEFTGRTALSHAKDFFCAHPEIIKNKVVLLYDSDTNKPPEDIGTLFVRKMDHNPDNTLFRGGVENLLVLPPDFDPKSFYSERRKTDLYGAESLIRELDKKALCSWLCEEVKPEDRKGIFALIKQHLDVIDALLKNRPG